MFNQDLESSLESILSNNQIIVTESLTTPSRPGKKPRPVWIVTGNISGLETFFRENGGRKFRGNWSFIENPSNMIAEELSQNGRKSFAEEFENTIARKKAKAERYEGYSENATKRAETQFERAQKIGAMIPMGQPILVGHYSEKKHRRDIARIDSGMRSGVEESKKAEHFDWKSNSLKDRASQMHSRSYVGNRIDELTAEINSLTRMGRVDGPCMCVAKEKIEFFKAQLLKMVDRTERSQSIA